MASIKYRVTTNEVTKCRYCGGVVGVDCDGSGDEDCAIRIGQEKPRETTKEATNV